MPAQKPLLRRHRVPPGLPPASAIETFFPPPGNPAGATPDPHKRFLPVSRSESASPSQSLASRAEYLSSRSGNPPKSAGNHPFASAHPNPFGGSARAETVSLKSPPPFVFLTLRSGSPDCGTSDSDIARELCRYVRRYGTTTSAPADDTSAKCCNSDIPPHNRTPDIA